MKYEIKKIKVRVFFDLQAHHDIQKAIEEQLADGWEFVYQDTSGGISTGVGTALRGTQVVTLIFRRPK